MLRHRYIISTAWLSPARRFFLSLDAFMFLYQTGQQQHQRISATPAPEPPSICTVIGASVGPLKLSSTQVGKLKRVYSTLILRVPQQEDAHYPWQLLCHPFPNLLPIPLPMFPGIASKLTMCTWILVSGWFSRGTQTFTIRTSMHTCHTKM